MKIAAAVLIVVILTAWGLSELLTWWNNRKPEPDDLDWLDEIERQLQEGERPYTTIDSTDPDQEGVFSWEVKNRN